MIKAVVPENIPECVNVIRTSFRTVADEFGFTEENAPAYVAFATDEHRLNYHCHVEKRPMYAWFDGGRIVGYYSLLAGEDGICELNNLCTLPEYRCRGIGKELLEHAFAVAKELGCSLMRIGIVEENRVLRAWYEAHGFVHLGTKKYDHFPFTCGYMERTLG